MNTKGLKSIVGVTDAVLDGRFRNSDDNMKSTDSWRSPDSQDRFRQHIANVEDATVIEINGWTEDSISYRYNQHGFRTDDEFDEPLPGDGIMFLGDSSTEGIGLNVEDTWAYRIAGMLGGRFYNLGQGGTGIETQYRLMSAWATILKPRAIYTIGHIAPRREILEDHGTIIVGPWWGAEREGRWVKTMDYSRVEKAMLSDDEDLISTRRTVDAMCNVASRLGIPLYAATDDTIRKANLRVIKERSWARDLKHFGRAYHDEIASDLGNFARLA